MPSIHHKHPAPRQMVTVGRIRTDPELVHAAIRAFTITPSVDTELARFVTELGAAAWPELDEIATSHPNPAIRARAARLRGP